MGGVPTSAAAAAIAAAGEPPAGQVRMGGQIYMPRSDGAYVPIETVKEKDKLQDQAVRDLHRAAEHLAQLLARFKAQAFDDVDQFQVLLAERYKAKVGGAKGNLTLYSFDGLLKVQVQVAELIKFGPELEAAKSLIDECMTEWAEGSRAELRAIVMDAFRVNQEGKLDRGRLLGLRRYDINDRRWEQAMRAIQDSILVIGSKRYIRFARRPSLDGAWSEISLNIATAGAPAAAAA